MHTLRPELTGTSDSPDYKGQYLERIPYPPYRKWILIRDCWLGAFELLNLQTLRSCSLLVGRCTGHLAFFLRVCFSPCHLYPLSCYTHTQANCTQIELTCVYRQACFLCMMLKCEVHVNDMSQKVRDWRYCTSYTGVGARASGEVL